MGGARLNLGIGRVAGVDQALLDGVHVVHRGVLAEPGRHTLGRGAGGASSCTASTPKRAGHALPGCSAGAGDGLAVIIDVDPVVLQLANQRLPLVACGLVEDVLVSAQRPLRGFASPHVV
jgi:hypothetical protein